MKTLINRKNERFTFLTIVFESIDDAINNCDENSGESVSRVTAAISGEDGFVVKSADGYKEFIRLAA